MKHQKSIKNHKLKSYLYKFNNITYYLFPLNSRINENLIKLGIKTKKSEIIIF